MTSDTTSNCRTETKVRTNSSTEFGSNPILIDRTRIISAAESNPILIVQIRTALDCMVDFNERIIAFTTGRACTPSSDIRQVVPLLTNRDILIRRGRLYSSCVRSSMLHRSETWPVRKENEVALQRAEMRMVRSMCNVKIKDIVPSKELRERLGIDDIILILQQNKLRWYRHVLRKEDTDWVKKCMEYEVEGSRPRGRLKKTWKGVVEKDCRT